MSARQGERRGRRRETWGGGWRTGARQRLALVSVCLGLGVLLAGCSIPFLTPSASDIYAHARGSSLKDATFKISGGGITTSNGEDVNLVVTGSGQWVVSPAAYALHLSIKLNGNFLTGTVTADSLLAGGKTYTRAQTAFDHVGTFGDAKYTATTAASAASLLPDLTKLTLVGQETIAGVVCWHIAGVPADGVAPQSATGGSTTVVDDLWINKQNYYPVRERVTALPGVAMPGANTGAGSAGNQGTLAGDIYFVVDFSGYNAGTSVAPPAAKDVAS